MDAFFAQSFACDLMVAWNNGDVDALLDVAKRDAGRYSSMNLRL
jgi:hypothetical protein